jgi:crotonobetainyl-CoA:carnitine CoA-transferase CaiB-like acyl-CoA transferase
MAGPSAGQILADLGADVIKIERPGVGDDCRGWGPPFLKDRNGEETKESAYFLSMNRGKRSLTVDLKNPEGQKIIRSLAAVSDIFLENFKFETLARFGLSYDDLKLINPKLVYCSITGFGQTGPRKKQAAYDFMIQAMGGLMSITGERDDKPGGGPQKVGIPITDLVSGLYAVIGALAAIAKRDMSGKGDYVDIGMLDSQVAILANQAMNFLISGKAPIRRGNAHPNIQPQDVFSCLDGDIAIAVGNDLQFAKLCKVLDLQELIKDKRYAEIKARNTNIKTLRPLIANKLMEKSRQYWVEKLDAVGVPASSINTIPEILEDDQVKAREMITYIRHPLAGKMPIVSSPIRFTETPTKHESPPPLLSEHTIDILHELNIEDDEIERLREKGII